MTKIYSLLRYSLTYLYIFCSLIHRRRCNTKVGLSYMPANDAMLFLILRCS